MMNFCIQCGTKAKPSAKFCAECGTALAPPPETPEVEPNIQANDPPFSTERKGIDESIYAPPLRSPEPSPRQNAFTPIRENDAAKPLALWNPLAAVGWSMLLSPTFGAWLLALNWKRIGDNRSATIAAIWGAGFFVVAFLVDIFEINRRLGASVNTIVFYGYLSAFYFLHALKQIEYVQKRLLNVYSKRRWRYPLLIAFPIWLLIIFATAGS